MFIFLSDDYDSDATYWSNEEDEEMEYENGQQDDDDDDDDYIAPNQEHQRLRELLLADWKKIILTWNVMKVNWCLLNQKIKRSKTENKKNLLIQTFRKEKKFCSGALLVQSLDAHI